VKKIESYVNQTTFSAVDYCRQSRYNLYKRWK